MSKNKNMHLAKKNKNNEFYTQLTDIEKELKHYREQFRNKIIFLNCDDPTESNFWKYFSLNFDFLGLKKLISTHYKENEPTYKLELLKYGEEPILTPLKQNGDFRSDECVELLKESDIVVTNPPFSLFREYIDVLVKYEKKFLVIGNMNAIGCKEIFKLSMNNRLWWGFNSPKIFVQPDGAEKKFGNIKWFTNLEHNKRNEELILYREYNEKDYPKYDNYDAIEVSKVKDIPKDYYGIMGVPITFMDSYNPNQFEILDANDYKNDKPINDLTARPFINGKEKYRRILIKRKTNK